jgi:glutathione S-transferase
MSDLKIYGNRGSRTARCLWLAAELGLDFEQIEVNGPREGKSEAHLARNPMGAVPVIDDAGFLLWESMAINLYLVRKHGGPLAPADASEDARAMQWSFWVMSECETWMLRLMFHGSREEPDTGEVEKAMGKLERPLAALEGSLHGRDYLLGDRFTVADVNVASVFAWAKEGNTDFGRWPRIDAWLDRCFARPRLIVDANPENW